MFGKDKAKVYITEIVNNTDEPIYLQTSADLNFSVSVQITKHISLKTGDEKTHLKASAKRNRARCFSFRPRTRNIIDGLEIPIVNPKYPPDDIYSYIHMYFRIPCTNDKQPEPFLGLRLLGDLLQFHKGTFGIRKISFNDEQKIIIGSPKKIRPGSTLTLEINQLTPMIYHRFLPSTRCRLANNTLAIAVKQNSVSCS